MKRFASLYGGKLPQDARENAAFCFVNPNMEEWMGNRELYPSLKLLLNHISYDSERLALLSFRVGEGDRAYVLDWAEVGRVWLPLKLAGKGYGPDGRERITEAFRRYWESRVPALEYAGGHSVPELVLWSAIGADRLRLEWSGRRKALLKALRAPELMAR